MEMQGWAKVDSTTECVPFVTVKMWLVGVTREGGYNTRRTIENDEITNIRFDFLRLEDQAGILSGTVSTNYDCHRFGRGK